MTVIQIVIGALRTILKGLVKGLENLEMKGQVEIIKTIEKSPGDVRRLSVTQTTLKDHQLMLELITLKEVK